MGLDQRQSALKVEKQVCSNDISTNPGLLPSGVTKRHDKNCNFVSFVAMP